MKPWTLILLTATLAHGADPRVERWIRSTLPPGARAMGPDVHNVKVDEQFVTVESAGLSMQSLGALEVRPYDGGNGIRRFAFRIPRHPKPAARPRATPLGVIGAFSNGVPLYNLAKASSAVRPLAASTTPCRATTDLARRSPDRVTGFRMKYTRPHKSSASKPGHGVRRLCS